MGDPTTYIMQQITTIPKKKGKIIISFWQEKELLGDQQKILLLLLGLLFLLQYDVNDLSRYIHSVCTNASTTERKGRIVCVCLIRAFSRCLHQPQIIYRFCTAELTESEGGSSSRRLSTPSSNGGLCDLV